MSPVTHPALKILLVGDRYTGKGQVGRAWGQTDADLPALQPVILYDRVVNVRRVATRVVSWVLSFDPEFESLRHHFYAGAHGIILTFNRADLNGLDSLDGYLGEIRQEIQQLPPMVLVGVSLEQLGPPAPESQARIAQWVAAHDALPYFEADYATPRAFAERVAAAFSTLLSRI